MPKQQREFCRRNFSVAARRRLALDQGFAHCRETAIGAAEIEPKHGENPRSWGCKHLSDGNLAEMRNLQDMAIQLHARQVRFDLFDQRAKRDSVVGVRYFPGFFVACNEFPQVLEHRAFQEQIMAKRHLNVVPTNPQPIKMAAQSNDVGFFLSTGVLRGKPCDDAVGGDEIQNVQVLDDCCGVGHHGFLIQPAPRYVRMRVPEFDEMMGLKIVDVGVGVSTDSGERGCRLSFDHMINGLVKLRAKRVSD